MNSSAARHAMIDNQLLTNSVRDMAVLEAMGRVPREYFVPEAYAACAYVDDEIALGAGRFLLEPLTLGRMLEALALTSKDNVLDVACGTGYSTAVISQLAGRVTGLEENDELGNYAASALAQLGLTNAGVVVQALKDGCSQDGPYDAIVVNGALHDFPFRLSQQLADGGRAVYVQRRMQAPGSAGLGFMMLVKKNGHSISQHHIFEASVPLLGGFEKHAAEFIF